MKLSVYCFSRFFALCLSSATMVRSSPPDRVSTHSHTIGMLLSPVFAVVGVTGVALGAGVAVGAVLGVIVGVVVESAFFVHFAVSVILPVTTSVSKFQSTSPLYQPAKV